MKNSAPISVGLRLPSKSAETQSGRGVDAADVYAQIYEAVLDHRLPPGTKLKEVPLAELFGVTRGSIRKAFTQLHAMNIIELRPNRGAIVASPSVAESRDLFAARRIIESSIVDILAREITKPQIRQLRMMVKQEEEKG